MTVDAHTREQLAVVMAFSAFMHDLARDDPEAAQRVYFWMNASAEADLHATSLAGAALGALAVAGVSVETLS